MCGYYVSGTRLCPPTEFFNQPQQKDRDRIHMPFIPDMGFLSPGTRTAINKRFLRSSRVPKRRRLVAPKDAQREAELAPADGRSILERLPLEVLFEIFKFSECSDLYQCNRFLYSVLSPSNEHLAVMCVRYRYRRKLHAECGLKYALDADVLRNKYVTKPILELIRFDCVMLASDIAVFSSPPSPDSAYDETVCPRAVGWYANKDFPATVQFPCELPASGLRGELQERLILYSFIFNKMAQRGLRFVNVMATIMWYIEHHQTGDVRFVELLVRNSSEPFDNNPEPLILALRRGLLGIVRFLLSEYYNSAVLSSNDELWAAVAELQDHGAFELLARYNVEPEPQHYAMIANLHAGRAIGCEY
ncbi:unnamed protein product [Kuraishia capsulata CBS 1993]|uniref:F-box domain-containing protein n=1 Tax=Kuraishia capsulata CBS 1993 TaxID=1382522 RepID=W6MKV0_9ASCO|nr:uncharacterized protein KUCA_T00002657001 [Kuraishia capsulata CBS 1993]CDK26683.1 unnamed protein product [Kuraishia capsulata CBS 1993]